MMDTSVLPDDTLGLHIELDEAAHKIAKRDDRNEANVGFGATTEGLHLTKTYLSKVTLGVTEKLAQRSNSNSAEFKLERLLRQLPPEVLALCILQAGLHAAGRWGANSVVDSAASIGTAINDELWAHKLLHTDAKLAKKINKKAKERFGAVEARKSYAKRLAEAEGFHMSDWGTALRVRAGHWGMELLTQSLPLVFHREDPHTFNGPKLWAVTEAGMEEAKQALAEAVCLSPVYQPRTECPPIWDRFVMRVAEDDRTLSRAQLLRTHHKDIMSAAGHAIRTGEMSAALKGINVLQSVPFKINTWIMDVIVACYNNDIRVDGQPSRLKFAVPKKLKLAEYNELSIEQRRLLSKTARGLKKANRANDADCIQFDADMRTAARAAVVEQFYTPMNMDWRARVYALTRFNFQREDRVRALFLFANGEQIGEEGLYWLKVHVANCGAFDGVDKSPMSERVKWVDAHLTTLTDYVHSPLQNTGWTKADSPFLFLAACRELISALEAGPSHVCHMPVSFDGSCSGLQHLAAMTLAPEGRLVNLTDNEIPEDIYRKVADIAKLRIEADLLSDEIYGKAMEDKPERKTTAPLKKLARMVLDYGVGRKLFKRNVMTFSYASTEFGMREQHYKDTMEPLELAWLKGVIPEHPFGETEDEWRLACRYLAERGLGAIKEVVSLPAQAMVFMQKLSKALAHEGKPLRWTSPAGVPCINRYHEAITEKVELWCYNNGVKQRTHTTVAVGFEKPIAKAKAAAGIAPNFTHSHDAAHLLLAVGAAADAGITDIVTVHDSFGCLPNRAAEFNRIIREQFLKMYTDHDVLSDLLESAKRDLTPANHWRLDEAIAVMPQKGTLNLNEIINAKYAFA